MGTRYYELNLYPHTRPCNWSGQETAWHRDDSMGMDIYYCFDHYKEGYELATIFKKGGEQHEETQKG